VLWILITVLVGLVVINVQLLLNFQRRSARIKIAHVPVLKVINDYKEKIAELGEGVRTMANASLSQLKVDLGKFQRRSGQAANLNAELDIDAQAWAAERAGEEGEEEELELEGEEELLPDEELQDEESDPRQSDGDRSDLDELLGGRKDIGYHVDNLRADPVRWSRPSGKTSRRPTITSRACVPMPPSCSNPSSFWGRARRRPARRPETWNSYSASVAAAWCSSCWLSSCARSPSSAWGDCARS